MRFDFHGVRFKRLEIVFQFLLHLVAHLMPICSEGYFNFILENLYGVFIGLGKLFIFPEVFYNCFTLILFWGT